MTNNWQGAAVGLAAAALLSSCATITSEEALEPVDIPAAWASDSEKSIENLPLNWLDSFADPALQELVQEAMNNNNDLGAAATRVEVARQSAVITRSGLIPSFSGSVGGQQNDAANPIIDDATGAIIGAGSRDFYNASISASWELDIWGRLTDGTRSAYLNKAAAEADFAASRLSIAGAVTRSWYNVIAAQLQRELAERDVETGEANLRITERRYERGVSSSLDVRLARSSLAASRASLISSQQTEQEAVRALEVLLGRYPSAELKGLESLPALTSLVDQSGAVSGLGTPATLLDRRPDVIAAEARMRGAGLDARAARKALLPSLSIRSDAGTPTVTQFSDLFDVDTVVASVSGSVVQPIFQGGRLRAQAKQQKALADQAVYNYVSTVLTAFQEVENAIAAETFLAAREDALRLAFEEAKASEELTERQYLSGTRNIFNLINAQQRRIQNEAQYIAATQARLSNRVGLYIALGGTFSAGEEKFNNEVMRVSNDTSPSLFRRWLGQIPGVTAANETPGASQ